MWTLALIVVAAISCAHLTKAQTQCDPQAFADCQDICRSPTPGCQAAYPPYGTATCHCGCPNYGQLYDGNCVPQYSDYCQRQCGYGLENGYVCRGPGTGAPVCGCFCYYNYEAATGAAPGVPVQGNPALVPAGAAGQYPPASVQGVAAQGQYPQSALAPPATSALGQYPQGVQAIQGQYPPGTIQAQYPQPQGAPVAPTIQGQNPQAIQGQYPQTVPQQVTAPAGQGAYPSGQGATLSGQGFLPPQKVNSKKLEDAPTPSSTKVSSKP